LNRFLVNNCNLSLSYFLLLLYFFFLLNRFTIFGVISMFQRQLLVHFIRFFGQYSKELVKFSLVTLNLLA
jgi:hypothetical protein